MTKIFEPYSIDEFGIKNWNKIFLILMPICLLLNVVVWASIGIYYTEYGANESTVKGYLDSLWLAWMATTTVGFGHIYPTTEEGRLVVGLAASLGICFYSAIGAFFSLIMFGRFDTEVENRELRRQNAEIIMLSKINESLNKEIIKTNLECINGNSIISTKLDKILETNSNTPIAGNLFSQI